MFSSIGRLALPHSQPGRVAVWLFAAFAAANAVVAILFALFGGSFWLTLFYPVITGSAIAGGVAAAVAVRHGDRGFLLLLPFIVLVAAVAFFVVELVAPHD